MDKWREVDKVITNMLTAGQENPYLRSQTIESLAGVLRDQFWSACESDPNIRRALKDAEKHGSEIVQIIQLAQSGEVELDETTWETLRPVLLRIDESIRLLGAIALDTEREAEAVREQARRTLERYRMLRVLRLDQKIDKALEQVGD